MVRVVHGTEDVHTLIRKAILHKPANHSSDTEVHEKDNNQDIEMEDVLETKINGVWCLSVGFRIFEPDFEAIKVIMVKELTLILLLLLFINIRRFK